MPTVFPPCPPHNPRKTGGGAGNTYNEYVAPNGKRYRSMKAALQAAGISVQSQNSAAAVPSGTQQSRVAGAPQGLECHATKAAVSSAAASEQGSASSPKTIGTEASTIKGANPAKVKGPTPAQIKRLAGQCSQLRVSMFARVAPNNASDLAPRRPPSTVVSPTR